MLLSIHVPKFLTDWTGDTWASPTASESTWTLDSCWQVPIITNSVLPLKNHFTLKRLETLGFALTLFICDPPYDFRDKGDKYSFFLNSRTIKKQDIKKNWTRSKDDWFDKEHLVCSVPYWVCNDVYNQRPRSRSRHIKMWYIFEWVVVSQWSSFHFVFLIWSWVSS